MGGGSSSTQSTMLGPQAQPFVGPMFQLGWDTIQNAFKKGQRPYNREMVSDWGEFGRQASKELSAGISGTGQGAQDLANLGIKTAQGGFLPSDQYTQNPFLQDVLKQAADRSMESYSQQILPNIRDAAIAGGAYGGARQDIQENQASQQAARASQEATQQIGYQDYNDFMNRYSQMWNAERNRMQGSGDILQDANQQFLAPGMARMALADQIRQNRQRRLDDSLARWTDANRIAPGWGFQMLPQFAGMLQNAGGSTQTTKQNSGGMDMVKTGLGLLGSIFGMFG
jgi:hypothetical protein